MIRTELETIFAFGRDERFEDGMESMFSKALVAYIEGHGESALKELSTYVSHEQVNAEVAAESLLWVGRIENPDSHNQRRQLLEHCLYHPSAYVRDGALLGLASMDDPKAIPHLEKAIRLEKFTLMRRNLQQVLDQLRETLLQL